jgi:hypothetical protein
MMRRKPVQLILMAVLRKNLTGCCFSVSFGKPNNGRLWTVARTFYNPARGHRKPVTGVLTFIICVVR